MFRLSRPLFLLSGIILGLFLAFPGTAGTSNTVSVPGISDIWLLGQATGTALQATGYLQSDVVPTNSPVLASSGVTLPTGGYVTFSATGTVDFGGCVSPSPDGGGSCGNMSSVYESGNWGTGSSNGLSNYVGPVNALVGVFVSSSPASGTVPSYINYNAAGATSQTTYSPVLNQVFFIGDGLTGTGTGTVQQFMIPTGATALYLSNADGLGFSFNDSGSFNVTVTAFPPATTSVPAVTPQVLLVTVLLLAGLAAYLLKSRSVAGLR